LSESFSVRSLVFATLLKRRVCALNLARKKGFMSRIVCRSFSLFVSDCMVV
jgi:hypothetical protein